MMSNSFSKDLPRNATIMVVGCGALGNEVLKNLALMETGRLVIVDFDKVEPANLHRSVLFSVNENCVGQPKVKIAAETLKRISPETEITAIDGDIAFDVGLGLIGRCDVVIGCVDNRWARYCINRLCFRAGKPWIDAGVSEFEGVVRVFEPGTSCYACSLACDDLNEMSRRFSCKGTIRRAIQTSTAPILPIVASIIAAVQVQEAFKLIHNKNNPEARMETLSGKTLHYDGKHLEWRAVLSNAYDDDCPHHESWPTPVKSDITADFTVKEALERLKELLDEPEVAITLVNDPFVEKICSRDDDTEYEVLLPSRKVERYINDSKELNRRPASGYYQMETSVIDKNFKHRDFTLSQIGIPQHEILRINARGTHHYVELS